MKNGSALIKPRLVNELVVNVVTCSKSFISSIEVVPGSIILSAQVKISSKARKASLFAKVLPSLFAKRQSFRPQISKVETISGIVNSLVSIFKAFYLSCYREIFSPAMPTKTFLLSLIFSFHQAIKTTRCPACRSIRPASSSSSNTVKTTATGRSV